MAVPLGKVSRYSGSRGRKRSPRVDEDQELRARQLERIGRGRYAERIRACGLPDGVLEFRSCGLRWCSRCATRTAAQNALRIRAFLGRMSKPIAVVLTVGSRSLDDLDRTLDRLGSALAALRPRLPSLRIGRFVGAVHPKLAESGRRWNVHVHAVFEGRPTVLPELETCWRVVTRGRGTLISDSRRRAVDDLDGYARYMADEKDWCPDPDDVRDQVLDVLIDAFKHRRLIVCWGFRRRRKRWIVVAKNHREPRRGRPRAR